MTRVAFIQTQVTKWNSNEAFNDHDEITCKDENFNYM